MSHTFTANYVHMVFSTSGRLPSIPETRMARLHDYIGGICRKLQVRLVAVGGTSDHLHLLMAIPAKLSISEVATKIKSNSSRWMSRRFAWQQGYGSFSVSPSSVRVVADYILHQQEHHARRSYEEELSLMLKKCGIDPSRL
jgi:putative transposase